MNEYRNTADRIALPEQTRRAVPNYAGGDKNIPDSPPAVLKILTALFAAAVRVVDKMRRGTGLKKVSFDERFPNCP